MIHPIYRVTSVSVVGPYTLLVSFNDKTTQEIDFKPVLAGEMYGPLRDLALFNQVQVDPDVWTLVWPNGADFDPATLHNWDQGDGEEIARRATKWDEVTSTSRKTRALS